MSIAALKNILCRAPGAGRLLPDSGSRSYGTISQQCHPKSRSSSEASTTSTLSPELDLEAQQGQQDQQCDNTSSPAPQKPGFRITARVISDATIGLSDGLTVPFALTAGLSALGNTRVVIFGGLAELIAGAISMGLGGYLGAKSEM